MKLPLAQIKVSGDEHAERGDHANALRLYAAVLAQVPGDYRCRLGVADALVALGKKSEAAAVYRVAAQLCIEGGQPLVAVVACRAISALGGDAGDLLDSLASTHGRGSPKIAEVGARLNVAYAGLELNERELRGERLIDDLVAEALKVGGTYQAPAELPPKFPPIPVLSSLTPEVLRKTVAAIVVHRLPVGHVLIRAGEPGTSCFLLAGGRVRVRGVDDTGVERELATLGSGALFGEMALITGSPRLATVEVCEPADVLEVGPDALAAMGDQLDQLAPALDKMARNRWMRNLLEQSPIFRIFEPEQRQDLLRRCSAHDVPKSTVLFAQGDKAKGLYLLLRGEIVLTRRQGNEVLSRTRLSAGTVAGIESVLDDKPAETTAKTGGPSTVLFLSLRFVRRLVEGVPEFANAVRQMAIHREKMTRPPI